MRVTSDPGAIPKMFSHVPEISIQLVEEWFFPLIVNCAAVFPAHVTLSDASVVFAPSVAVQVETSVQSLFAVATKAAPAHATGLIEIPAVDRPASDAENDARKM